MGGLQEDFQIVPNVEPTADDAGGKGGCLDDSVLKDGGAQLGPAV